MVCRYIVTSGSNEGGTSALQRWQHRSNGSGSYMSIPRVRGVAAIRDHDNTLLCLHAAATTAECCSTREELARRTADHVYAKNISRSITEGQREIPALPGKGFCIPTVHTASGNRVTLSSLDHLSSLDNLQGCPCPLWITCKGVPVLSRSPAGVSPSSLDHMQG